MSKTFADLVAFLAGFSHDPYKFVMAAFPWGEKGTELERMSGPDEWQKDVLNDIRDGLKDPSTVIREAVASGNGIGKAQRLTDVIDTPDGRSSVKLLRQEMALEKLRDLPMLSTRLMVRARGAISAREIMSLAVMETRRRSFNVGGMNLYRSIEYILTMVLTSMYRAGTYGQSRAETSDAGAKDGA